MSSLRDRLARLKSNSSDGTKAEQHTRPAIVDEWSGIDARYEHNEWGGFMIREVRHALDYRHGAYCLGKLAEEPSSLSELSPAGNVKLNEVLFFDTETTGLGIGAGNVPFMIGLGFYESDEFVIRQLFIRNPAEETAMLHYLLDQLQRFSHLVSYNGRTFDWPLIKNRYILNRIPFGAQEVYHLDLLYPSRSLWKNTLPSCRLGKVEEDRLGIVRTEDVPGSLAPALYFQYLSSGDPAVVEGVFRHNELDILTLSCLAAHFSDLLSGQFDLSRMENEEMFRLGVWLDKLGRNRLAEEVFAQLITRHYERNHEHCLPLASIYKKKGNYERAAELWKSSIHGGNNGRMLTLEPFIELAMYYEHRRKDLRKASYYAEEALQCAWKRLSLSRGDQNQRLLCEELQRRIERLNRKGAKSKEEDQGAGELLLL